MRRTCALISVLVLANVLSPYTFSSETAFTLSPVKLYREAPRGGVAEIGLVVINDNPLRGQAFKVYVTDLTMDKNGQAVFRPPGTSEWSAAPWITLDQERLELGPLDRSMITGTINVPRNLNTGGARLAAIMVEAIEPELKGQVRIVLRKRSAAFLILTIRNSRQLRLAEITELTGALTPGEGYTFSTALSNKGNMYVSAVANISLVDENYLRWGEAILAETPQTLYPGAVREFQALLQRRLPAGEYTARATFYYGRKRAYKEIPFIVTEQMAGDAGALPLAITYEPESINFEGPPRAFRRQVVKYKSHEVMPVKLEIAAVDEDEAGSQWSAVSWVEAVPNTIELGPRQARNITLVLRLPDDATGERFAKLVTTGQLQEGEPTQWDLPLVVSVPGTLEARGRITEMEMLEPATDSAPYAARIGFENLGNCRLTLTGRIQVLKTERYEEVSSVPFEGMVYPGQERTVEVVLPWGLAAEQYLAAATLTGVTSDEKSSVKDTRSVEFTVKWAPEPESVEEIQLGGIEDETQQ